MKRRQSIRRARAVKQSMQRGESSVPPSVWDALRRELQQRQEAQHVHD